jgi:hypothetical protein
MVYLGAEFGDQQQCSFRRSRMNGACTKFDVNAAGKITVIKGASGLQFGGDSRRFDYYRARFG